MLMIRWKFESKEVFGMKRLITFMILISLFVVAVGGTSGKADDADIAEGIRLGATKKDVIQQLRKR